MKRLMLLLLLLPFVVEGMSQSKFEIESFSGNVQYKVHRGTQWSKVTLHQQIGVSDSILIPQRDSIVLLNTVTKELYPSLSTGKFKMYDIVQAVNTQSGQLIKLASDVCRKNIEDKFSNLTYSKSGASYRDLNVDGIEDSIVSVIQTLLYHSLMGNLSSSDSLLTFVTMSDRGAYMSIVNKTNSDLYVNILCINKDTKRAHLLYTDLEDQEPYIFIPSGVTIPLDMRHFANLESFILIPFGTLDAYNTNDIATEITYLDVTTIPRVIYTKYIVGKVVL